MTLDAQALFNDRSRSRLLALCAHLGGRDAAEDLLQETLLEAWRQRRKVQDVSGGDAWLAAIARNIWRRSLRASHRHARAAEAAVSALELHGPDSTTVELERHELAEVLDSALGLLPDDTREAVVRRFVDGSSHAEIASRLGISPDAVSMRISRGRLMLRRALETSDPEVLSEAGLRRTDGWRRTRLACPICGMSSMDVREQSASIAFRCVGCEPSGNVPSSVYRLDNPSWASVVGGLSRPSAVVRRAGRFVHDYLTQAGNRQVAACTRCGADVAVGPAQRTDTDLAHRHGVYIGCRACGEMVWVSAAGRALALPELQEFQRHEGRMRLAGVVELVSQSVPALALQWRSMASAARHDVVLKRETLQPLHVSRVS